MAKVEGGFPHSEIQGSKPVRGSPRLIAAYHVLHRLSAPRHPPDTLMTLDHSHHRCPPGSGDPCPAGHGTSTLGTPRRDAQVHPQSGPKTFASERVRDEGRSRLPVTAPALRGPSHDGKAMQRRSAPSVRAASASCACLAAGPSGRTHSLFTMSNNTLRPEGRAMRRPDGPAANSLIADGLGSLGVGVVRSTVRPCAPPKADGGARRDRTDDLMLAKHALYRLSYCPGRERSRGEAPRSRSRGAVTGGPGKTRTSDLTLIKRAL